MNRILSALALSGAVALTICAKNRTMFVHHHGQIDPFFFSEIDSMRYSPIDLDSTLTSAALVHEIWTPDSTYRYRVAEIDSVTFQSPAAVARPNTRSLADLEDFITGENTDDGLSLTLLPSTPATLLPKAGECIYLEKPTQALPAGFAGRVKTVESNAGAIVLKCESVELHEIFSRLAWVGENSFKADESQQPEMATKSVLTPWLVSRLNYPDLIEGAYIMTDELRDIPAGPEQAKISGRVAVHPSVSCLMGSYILPQPNGETMKVRRMRSEVTAGVRASAEGRGITEKKMTVGTNEKISLKLPMGFGQTVALTYKATMAVKGTIGVDYDFSGSYRSSAVSKIVYDDMWNMGMESEFTHLATDAISHSLSASMDGELTLNGSLSLTMTQSGDSLKSVTHTYVYGSALKGSALFLNSQIDKAADNNELYRNLTSGITAKPLQSIVGTAKYSIHTLKTSAKLAKSDSIKFYAVPRLNMNKYDSGTRAISYNVSGTPMKFAASRLGIAVQNQEGTLRRSISENVWPSQCGKTFEMPTDYDASKDAAIYPTVTLPSGETILAAPKYPRAANEMFPVAATLESNGLRLTMGVPIIGSGAENGVSVHVGNFFPFKTTSNNPPK